MGALLGVLLLAPLACAAPLADGAREVPGGFRVSRPNPMWAWGATKARTLCMARGDAGVEMVFTWADNRSGMESKRAATSLRYRLLDDANSMGREFSLLHEGKVAGHPSSWFTVKQFMARKVVHRTQYTVVANGRHCLVIMVMGPEPLLKLYASEINAIVASVQWLGS